VKVKLAVSFQSLSKNSLKDRQAVSLSWLCSEVVLGANVCDVSVFLFLPTPFDSILIGWDKNGSILYNEFSQQLLK
jgi:hypothetical protein